MFAETPSLNLMAPHGILASYAKMENALGALAGCMWLTALVVYFTIHVIEQVSVGSCNEAFVMLQIVHHGSSSRA